MHTVLRAVLAVACAGALAACGSTVQTGGVGAAGSLAQPPAGADGLSAPGAASGGTGPAAQGTGEGGGAAGLGGPVGPVGAA